MLAPLALALALWVLTRWLGARAAFQRGLPLAVIGLVMAAQLLLPETSGFRQATGGSIQPWLIFCLVAGVVIGYRALLGAARSRAKPHPIAADTPTERAAFTEEELERYSRHIMLREIGGAGQRALKDAKVAMVGAGGLGSPALLYLAAAGVRQITLIEDDTVDLSNLQRQIIHDSAALGRAKARSAAEKLAALDPHVALTLRDGRIDENNARDWLSGHDLVLDGSDNFATRYLLNAHCAALSIPLIAGAMTQWEGQLSIWDPARGAPCYACIFPEAPAAGLVPSCAEAGIVSPLPGVIGSLMALEAVKLLARAGEPLRGRLLIYDALYAESRSIALKPRADCPICSDHRPSQPVSAD